MVPVAIAKHTSLFYHLIKRAVFSLNANRGSTIRLMENALTVIIMRRHHPIVFHASNPNVPTDSRFLKTPHARNVILLWFYLMTSKHATNQLVETDRESWKMVSAKIVLTIR